MVKGWLRSRWRLGLRGALRERLGRTIARCPIRTTFLKETRKHLQTDSTIQRSYMYVETRREVKLDKDGRTVEAVGQGFRKLPGAAR